MKQFLLLIFLFFAFKANGQNQLYDSVLAKKLGADNNGMKGYILVLLKTGPNNTTNKLFIDSCCSLVSNNIDLQYHILCILLDGEI